MQQLLYKFGIVCADNLIWGTSNDDDANLLRLEAFGNRFYLQLCAIMHFANQICKSIGVLSLNTLLRIIQIADLDEFGIRIHEFIYLKTFVSVI